jgi:hypothetical protein
VATKEILSKTKTEGKPSHVAGQGWATPSSSSVTGAELSAAPKLSCATWFLLIETITSGLQLLAFGDILLHLLDNFLGNLQLTALSTRYGRQSTDGYAQGSRLSIDKCASYELDGDTRQTQGFIQFRPP